MLHTTMITHRHTHLPVRDHQCTATWQHLVAAGCTPGGPAAQPGVHLAVAVDVKGAAAQRAGGAVVVVHATGQVHQPTNQAVPPVCACICLLVDGVVLQQQGAQGCKTHRQHQVITLRRHSRTHMDPHHPHPHPHCTPPPPSHQPSHKALPAAAMQRYTRHLVGASSVCS